MTTWTDNQFINYFNANPKNVCGRLYETDLNKIFYSQELIKTKNFNYDKALAIILTFFTINNTVSASTLKKFEQQKEFKTQEKYNLNDTLKITVRIENENLEKIKGVKISFLNEIYYTDEKGEFIISLSNTGVTNTLISFYFEGYKQEVRNYNIAMGSTNYFIKLEKPSLGRRIIAGGISPSCYIPDNNDENFVIVQAKKLHKNTKEILDRFSLMLKQNPNFEIDLQTYYLQNSEGLKFKANLIRNYLIEMQGISADRLFIVEPEKTTKQIQKNKIFFMPHQN